MPATSTLSLETFKLITDSNFSRLVKEAPRLHRVKLKAVGACNLTLKGRNTGRSRSFDDTGSLAASATDLSDVSWTFDITERGSHQVVKSTLSQADFDGVILCEDEVPGIIFAGDMTDWRSNIFREQGVQLIRFSPTKGARATHDAETGDLTLTSQGRLYRGGKDSDAQVAGQRKGFHSTNESD